MPPNPPQKTRLLSLDHAASKIPLVTVRELIKSLTNIPVVAFMILHPAFSLATIKLSPLGEISISKTSPCIVCSNARLFPDESKTLTSLL